MVRCAAAHGAAWEDEAKPPHERRTHHLLVLGQGGSGKTHVVQNNVFEAVHHLWPPTSHASPALMVVAFSNAQAKNISTTRGTARTLHNVCVVRAPKLINSRMRPGGKTPPAHDTLGQRACLGRGGGQHGGSCSL